MITPIHEITLEAKVRENVLSRITLRVVGLSREGAIAHVMRIYSDDYNLHHVIAGPRLDYQEE